MSCVRELEDFDGLELQHVPCGNSTVDELPARAEDVFEKWLLRLSA
jgi:hypothetical protein